MANANDFNKTDFTVEGGDPDAKDGKPAEFEIEVVDDTPPADRNRTPLPEPAGDVTDEELQGYQSPRAKQRIQQLGKGIHDERRSKEAAHRERDEAVRLAQQVVEENKRLQGSLVTNHNMMLTQAKASAALEIADATRDYKSAYETGDVDGVTAAQAKLTAAQIKADRFNNFAPATVQTENKSVQPRPNQAAAPLDAKTTAWMERNTWFGANKKMTAYALGLHDELLETGVPSSSDEYFKRIDADLRDRFPETFAGESADAPTSQRQKPNVVASASRSTQTKKIVLTQSQVAIAKRLGLPLEVYARQVAIDRSKNNG